MAASIESITQELRRARREAAAKPLLTFETALVMDAKEMYSIIAAAKKAGCGAMIYRWRKEGFDVERSVSEEQWNDIARASRFMEQVVHSCPYFMRFDFFLSKERVMKIHVDEKDLLMDVYSMNLYELENLLEPKYERDRVWRGQEHGQGYYLEDEIRAVMPDTPANLNASNAFADAMKELKADMLKNADDLYAELWTLVAECVAPFGFEVVAEDDRNDMVQLIAVEGE